jgi:hypothetical protein
MRNQSLIEGEKESSDEGYYTDAPPAKRARTDRVALDAEEAAFASSLGPLHSTSGADGDEDEDRAVVEDGDGVGDGDVGVNGTVQHGRDDVDYDGDGNGEDQQEGMGFLDNGVCFSVFSMKL